jgi:hypothetical protein
MSSWRQRVFLFDDGRVGGKAKGFINLEPKVIFPLTSLKTDRELGAF